MKVKDVFMLMSKANELKRTFGEKEYIIRVYFNEYYGKEFKNYREFITYIRKEYTKRYVEILLDQDLQETLDKSLYIVFESYSARCSVEMYLDEER